MYKFEYWVKEKHPEFEIDEGMFSKIVAPLAIAGAMSGQGYGEPPTPPSKPAITQSVSDKWETYKQSKEGKEFLRQLKQIPSMQKRMDMYQDKYYEINPEKAGPYVKGILSGIANPQSPATDEIEAGLRKYDTKYGQQEAPSNPNLSDFLNSIKPPVDKRFKDIEDYFRSQGREVPSR